MFSRTIFHLILLCTAVAMLLLFIHPMFMNMRETQSEIWEYREAVEKASEFNNLLSELTRDADNFTQQELYRVEQFVPDIIETTEVVARIENIVVRNLLSLNSVTVAAAVENIFESDNGTTASADTDSVDPFAAVQQRVKPVTLVSQDISLVVVGTYEQFKLLLQDLESSAQLFDIVNVKFTGGDTDLLEFSLVVRVYGLNEKPKIAEEDLL